MGDRARARGGGGGSGGRSVSEPARAQVPAASTGAAGGWQVRPARRDDVAAVAGAVRALLVELGGTPASATAMRAAVQELIDSPWAGAVLVAESGDGLVGVLAASWQLAIHVAGRYALIQEVWVDRGWRGRAIGGAMLSVLLEIARARHLEVVEVGLPRASFAGLAASEAFYGAHGFVALGRRMRLTLA
jgi:GNAT superfamily N-acetyltransferase